MSGARTPSAPDAARAAPPAAGQADDQDTLVGHVLDGKYQIDARVARAETGLIYRGTNVTIGTVVAIKVMTPQMQQDAALVERFERETRLRSLLEHPNCVAVLDHGRDPEGRLYTVMEYVEGQRLSAIVAESTPMPLERIVRIASQVLAALDEAHAHGIVHGEVKSFSVQVTDRPADPDFVQLLGFGRLQDALLKGEAFDVEAPYASPEQARGEVDILESSDIWSAGVMLYEMLAGRPPFIGERAQVLEQVRSAPIPPPTALCPDADVNPRLEALIMRCLSRDPASRPASVDAFGRELLALVQPGGSVAGLTGRISLIAPAITTSSDNLAAAHAGAMPARSRRALVAGVAGALLVLVALGSWLLLRDSSSPAREETAHAAATPQTPPDSAQDTPGTAEPVADEMPADGVLEGPLDDGTSAAPEAGGEGATAQPRSSRREPATHSAEGAVAPADEDDLVMDFEAGGGAEPTGAQPGAAGSLEYNEEDVDRELKEAKRKKRSKRSTERRRDSVTETMLDKAEDYLKRGNKAGARTLVERVLERDPNNRDALKLKRRLD